MYKRQTEKIKVSIGGSYNASNALAAIAAALALDIPMKYIRSGLAHVKVAGRMEPVSYTHLSVGKAANQMIEEVRRQFRSDKGIMEGTSKPDYANCVDISTKAALTEMILPGLMAIIAPLAVGIVLGTAALGGMLAGSLSSGVLLAIMMANAGGAWDNAKKYICLLYTSCIEKLSGIKGMKVKNEAKLWIDN